MCALVVLTNYPGHVTITLVNKISSVGVGEVLILFSNSDSVGSTNLFVKIIY